MVEDASPVAQASNLCEYCAAIDFQAIYNGQDWKHMPDATKLLTSSETCDLCGLVCSTIEQDAGYDRKSAAAFWEPQSIVLRRPLLYVEEDEDAIDDLDEPLQSDTVGPLADLEVAIPVNGGWDIARLGLRNLSGTDVDGPSIIAPGESIERSDAPAAFRRMHHWMYNCLSNHQRCDKEISRYGKVTLPTRLLRISPDDSQPCQLLHTSGMDVEYVALSHCWGKHRLLTTTKANLSDHLMGIPLDRLPKTFLEAMVVSRRLGVLYIWIDSLCIIQDDDDDWKREALRMGSVYSGAKFTIAAAGAEDSSEGLFMERPALAAPVTIPYGSLKIELHQHPDQKYGHIDFSALDDRAWITQEFLLSKRIIHFTKAQLIWSCSTMNEAEDGEQIFEFERESMRRMLATAPNPGDSDNGGQSFFDDWNQIAKRYCSRQLTYPSDKPIAIRGLADVLGASSGLSYKHGIWVPQSRTSINISQLMWYCKFSAVLVESMSVEDVRVQETLRRPDCLQHLPSWSWTSTIGDVAFNSAARDATPIPRSITLQGDALIITQTHLLPVTPQRAPDIYVGAESQRPFEFFSQAALFEGTMLLPSGLYNFGTIEEPIGWGSFVLPPKEADKVFCCAMSMNPKDAQGHHDGVNVFLLKPHPTRPDVFVMLGVGEVVAVHQLLAQPQVDVRIE